MIAQVTDAVDRLIVAARDSPHELPLRELAAVHQTGRDVRIDSTSARVIAVVEPRRHPSFDTLTPREQQVAEVVAAGYTNQQIAVELSISLGTVKDHVHSILTKTGFDSRSRLIAAWYGAQS